MWKIDVLRKSGSKLAKDKQLAGFSFEGKWFDIGTPQAYEKAIKEWKK